MYPSECVGLAVEILVICVTSGRTSERRLAVRRTYLQRCLCVYRESKHVIPFFYLVCWDYPVDLEVQTAEVLLKGNLSAVR